MFVIFEVIICGCGRRLCRREIGDGLFRIRVLVSVAAEVLLVVVAVEYIVLEYENRIIQQGDDSQSKFGCIAELR